MACALWVPLPIREKRLTVTMTNPSWIRQSLLASDLRRAKSARQRGTRCGAHAQRYARQEYFQDTMKSSAASLSVKIANDGHRCRDSKQAVAGVGDSTCLKLRMRGGS